jgi:hypothetical protein
MLIDITYTYLNIRINKYKKVVKKLCNYNKNNTKSMSVYFMCVFMFVDYYTLNPKIMYF